MAQEPGLGDKNIIYFTSSRSGELKAKNLIEKTYSTSRIAARAPRTAPREATSTREWVSESGIAMHSPAEWSRAGPWVLVSRPTRCGDGYRHARTVSTLPSEALVRWSNGDSRGYLGGRARAHALVHIDQTATGPPGRSPRVMERASAHGLIRKTIPDRPPTPPLPPPSPVCGSRRRGLERRTGSPVTA